MCVYLEKAKIEFDKLLSLAKHPFYYEACTSKDIQELKEILKLPLPKAYEEFLLWIGRGSDCTDPFGIGHYSRKETNLQEEALANMDDNGTSEVLPKDAIVFAIPEENCSFAFIRVSEGNNPPVHYFPGLIKGKDGKYCICHDFVWNWFLNLEELCIAMIEDYMDFSLIER